MKILKRVESAPGVRYGYRFECPGCGVPHVIPVEPSPKGWGFNENEEAPTFTPSILVYPHRYLIKTPDEFPPDGLVGESPLCHSFVRDGKIEFLSDSTHPLAGKTVPLPPIDGT